MAPKAEPLPTLREFLDEPYGVHGDRAFVSHPGWGMLYVRRTRRFLDNTWVFPVLDLARIEAVHPNQGTFTRLLKYLRRMYPHYTIYVESVQTERFIERLLKLGFVRVQEGSASLYLFPNDSKTMEKVTVKKDKKKE